MIDAYCECPKCSSPLCKHGLCTMTGDPWTDGCRGSYGEDGYQCQDCAEAAEQRFFEDYYGGESVFCMSEAERMDEARRVK